MNPMFFNPPPAQRDALQDLWEMHDQTMQSLQRIETLLQRLLDAQTAAAERPEPPQPTPG
jgi:hypothetical protein